MDWPTLLPEMRGEIRSHMAKTERALLALTCREELSLASKAGARPPSVLWALVEDGRQDMLKALICAALYMPDLYMVTRLWERALLEPQHVRALGLDIRSQQERETPLLLHLRCLYSRHLATQESRDWCDALLYRLERRPGVLCRVVDEKGCHWCRL